MSDIIFHTSEHGNLWYMHGQIELSGCVSNTYTNNHDVINMLFSKSKLNARERIIGELKHKYPDQFTDEKRWSKSK